jgi:3-carboxy-cis,cis-muconate cycloisomerase
MPTHVLDSAILKDLYGTPEMRAVFDDMSLLQKWLDTEAALAQSEAELGLIPVEAAAEISRRARVDQLDLERMKHLVDETVHPLMPLIRVLQAACQGGAGEYIHWGATTQDIMDTAMILQVKDAIAIFERRLDVLIDSLAELAACHRDTPMAGRTHGQQALPITFGYKVAVWLAEVLRHRQRLAECKPRALVGQFGGAVGTLASVSAHGLQIQAGLLARLGLGVPLIAWHTARDNLAEFASVLALVAATTGKIAREVISLQRTEIAEVEEPFNTGKIGSSTMPHKRNPMLCEAILALARYVMHVAPVAMEAMIQEHERDWTGDHLEWAYLPEICVMTDGAVTLTTRVVTGLQVYPAQMRANLGLLNGLMLSEAVMLALAEKIGRQSAHDIIYACSMRAAEAQLPFRQTLAEDPIVARHLSAAEREELLDPLRYSGLAATFVDRVLASAQTVRRPSAADGE